MTLEDTSKNNSSPTASAVSHLTQESLLQHSSLADYGASPEGMYKEMLHLALFDFDKFMYIVGISSTSHGYIFPSVSTLRTINGRATFTNLFLPPFNPSYSSITEDNPDGHAGQPQKYVKL